MLAKDLSLEWEPLIELSCDETLKSAFRSQTLLDFWIQQRTESPALSDKAVRFLLPFKTTYLCEKGFSSLTFIKTKYRTRLDAEPSLRLLLVYRARQTPLIRHVNLKLPILTKLIFNE